MTGAFSSTIGEWFRPAVVPPSLQVAIDRAYARRTVATSAEAVALQREIALSQAQWQSKVLDGLRDGNALVRNISSDLALVIEAMQPSMQGFATFADRVGQHLLQQRAKLDGIEDATRRIGDGVSSIAEAAIPASRRGKASAKARG